MKKETTFLGKVIALFKLCNVTQHAKINFTLSIIFRIMCTVCYSLEILLIKSVLESPDNNFIFLLFIINSIIITVSGYCKKTFKVTYQVELLDTYRLKVVNKVLHLDYENYTSIASGILHNTINNVKSMVKNIENAVLFFEKIFLIIIQSCIILYVNVYLGLVVLVLLPIIYHVYKSNNKKINSSYSDFKTALKDIDKRFAIITNILSLIRSKNTEEEELNYIENKGKVASNALILNTKLLARSDMKFNIVFYTVTTIIVILNKFIIKSSVVEILAIITYFNQLINPVLSIQNCIDLLEENFIYYENYCDLINIENSINYEDNTQKDDFKYDIELENVSFKYKGSERNVLNNINLRIRKGEKIGICGKSGGGKSSLIYLLNRFYDPTQGDIKIDGINMKSISNESLRKLVSYISQDTDIIDGTIRDNITYGMSNVNEEEIIDICKKSNLYDFINSLPDGLNTEVGTRGLKLSGGQKQRISIARAYLQNAPILLLDEATSALDNESESIIQESLDEIGKDKTVISIAHRLSTIKNCDRIIVIDNNKIAEIGNHDELIAKGEIYYQLNN